MKKLLFVFILIPIMGFGQLNKDSIMWTNESIPNLHMFVGSIVPKHQLVINGDNNKQLYFDFKGDSLKVSGDLNMNEAAIKFIEFIEQQYTREIFRLNADSTIVTFSGNKYIKETKTK